MPAFTLFGQKTTAALTADTANYTLGVQFSVSAPATLTAIWFYSAPGATDLPVTIALFAVSGASLITSQAASWSGAAGSGWVRAAFTSPPALTPGTAYKACVLHSAVVNWYAAIAAYWTSGAGGSGITNGPLSAPNNAAAAQGQDSFNLAAALTYPASTGNGANYQVDPEVTVPGGMAQLDPASAMLLDIP